MSVFGLLAPEWPILIRYYRAMWNLKPLYDFYPISVKWKVAEIRSKWWNFQKISFSTYRRLNLAPLKYSTKISNFRSYSRYSHLVACCDVFFQKNLPQQIIFSFCFFSLWTVPSNRSFRLRSLQSYGYGHAAPSLVIETKFSWFKKILPGLSLPPILCLDV